MDGNQTGKDGLPVTGLPSSTKESPSDKKWSDAEAEFLGQWHAEEYARKRHSTLDSRIAELTNEKDSSAKTISELTSKLETMQSERDKLIESKAGGVDFLKVEQKLKDLDKREAEIQVSMKVINEYKRSKRITDLAEFYVKDPAARVKFAEKLTKLNPQTPEQAEEFAKVLAADLQTSTSQRPDSLSGSSATSDEQFMKDYAAGRTNDHKRAKQIMDERNKGG